MKPPEYVFVCSLVAGDESEGEVVGIGGGAQADEFRSVVPVFCKWLTIPRPPGGRGEPQGESVAISVLGVTPQPVEPFVAPELHLPVPTTTKTALPAGSPDVSVPEQEQS